MNTKETPKGCCDGIRLQITETEDGVCIRLRADDKDCQARLQRMTHCCEEKSKDSESCC